MQHVNVRQAQQLKDRPVLLYSTCRRLTCDYLIETCLSAIAYFVRMMSPYDDYSGLHAY